MAFVRVLKLKEITILSGEHVLGSQIACFAPCGAPEGTAERRIS